MEQFSMNGAYFHLLTNHFPIVGFLFGIVFLSYALWKSQEELKRVALFSVLLTSLMTLIAYFSGFLAENVVVKLNGINETFIELHEGWAQSSLVLSLFAGGLSLFGLYARKKADHLFGPALFFTLIFGFLAFGSLVLSAPPFPACGCGSLLCHSTCSRAYCESESACR